MKRVSFLICCLSIFLCSCNQTSNKAKNEKQNANIEQIAANDILESDFLTSEQQALLTPEAVLASLKAGNADFVSDNLIIRNTSLRVRAAVDGQYPKAVVLSCLDSRVPVEDVFHCGIGDIFVARVAGNIIDEDMLASMEYACKVSGAKLVLVLGHGHCGAIKSAISNVKMGNISTLLFKIQPAVAEISETFKGERNSSNKEYVDAVCKANVELGLSNIRKYSPILKEMEDDGEIMILGGIYEMETGEVHFMK